MTDAATPPGVEQIDDLVRRCVQADRVVPFSSHVLESSAGERIPVFDGDDLIALAVLLPADPGELAVDPGFRRRGVGGGLLDRVLAHAPRVWAHGDLPAARALAVSRGLTAVRTLMQLRRPLAVSDDEPAATLPPGVTIRTFRPGTDDTSFLQVNARAFAFHPEQGRLDQAGLDVEMGQDWFDPAGFFLAVDSADRVLGYHWTKVHAVDPTPGAERPEPLGEVYVLGVDPLSPIRRLGTPLLAAGLEHLRSRGLRTVALYVEADNEPALALYRRFGFRPHLTDVVYALPG